MKKLVILGMAVVMMMSFAACGDKDTSSDTASTSTATESVDAGADDASSSSAAEDAETSGTDSSAAA